MAFNETQVKSLEAKLSAKHVRTRQANDTTLTYVEGWHVIAEANRIFGFDAWDRRTLSTECVWSGSLRQQQAAAYIAQVRIVVRAGDVAITREGCGSGEAKASTPGDAHDLALKAAETDATKRALATFGNPFGLALYDRELAGVTNRKGLMTKVEQRRGPWLLSSLDGSKQSFDRSEDFAAALRRDLTEAADIEGLFSTWERNVDTVRAINRHARRSGPSAGMGHVLAAHLKGCAIALAKQNSKLPPRDAPSPQDGAHNKVDKSVLAIPEIRRIRSKEHLQFVARQPCVVCGRTPSHAHHLRHAQPRGLGLKVSDEFTVPLCAIHHDDIHRTSREREWWRSRDIDPLPIAAALWRKDGKAGGSGLRSSEEATERDPEAGVTEAGQP
jgi:Rad52/22 family double-strand break repair protein